MATYRTQQEKMEILAAYNHKFRNLKMIRLGLVAMVTVIFFNMRKLSRTGLFGISMFLFCAGALGTAVVTFVIKSMLYCPLCGEHYGYKSGYFQSVPGVCPHCNERLK